MLGTRLANRYEILREIGRGGMGIVYLARDPELDRTVAIKIVTPELLSAETAQRFKREARVVAKMDHPSVVTVYDSGEHEGSLFFVMPFVEGKNLRVLLQHQSLSLGELIDLAIQVAEALEYSHARGVVHRDIKPENIMVTRSAGEGLRVRVMDFGLAMGPAHERITRTAAVVGTIAYMSPEQVTGKEVDSRSDIYSFATVLYECLVGQTPFSGEIQALVYRISHELPMPPRTIQKEIDEEIEDLLLKCLEKDPDKRLTGKEIANVLIRYRKKLESSGRNQTMLPTASMLGMQPQPRKAVRPFVGRDKEFGALQHRLNAAVSGESQFVLVTGEAGIGKSRLLEELETLAKARGIPALHGRFLEINHALPYQGYCEVIQEYFRSSYSAKSDAHPDFSDLADDLTTLFPVLAECKELVRSDESFRAAEPTRKFEDRTYIFELLARTLIRIAAGKPLILLLEDLHAANVSVEALDYIIRRLAPTPTLIVGTYRTTEVDKRHPLTNLLSGFKGDKRFTLIPLGPLSASGHREYLQELIGASKLDDSMVHRFYQATDGNPYFTYELVRSLIDSGGIVKDESGISKLSSDTAISIEELPVTIQQTVAERIERLPKDLREVLSLASVLGRTFEFDHLESLDPDNEELENAVEQLIHSGFIEEERQSRSDLISFSSGMLRDVLYASLPRRKRRSLHRKHAEELEKKNAGRLERVYAQLFDHYAQADVPEKVIEYGFLLARKSLEAFSADDAIRVTQMVLDFLEDDPEKQLEIAEAGLLLAQGHRMAGNTNDALEALESSVAIFEKQKERERLLSALLLGVEIAWQSRKAEETWRWIGRGLDLAGVLKANAELTQLLSLAATVANLRGEYEKAQEYLEEVEKLKPSRDLIAEEELQGGTITVAMTNPCSARHPTKAFFNEEVEILSNIFETLVVSDDQGNLIPHLCERWETLNEGGLFLFVLRKDIHFHDGRKLTAGEVKQSFEDSIRKSAAALLPAFSSVHGVQEFLSGRANHVSGITAQSENILQIQLTERLPIYPALLTDPRTGVVGLQKDNPVETTLIGTGPFQIASDQPGSIKLERYNRYWTGKHPILDAIDFRVGCTSGEVAQGFRSGEYDIARDLLPNDLEEILRDRRLRAMIVEAPKKNIYFALFNNSSELLKIPAIRQALCGITHSHDLVTRTLGRFALPAEGVLPPSILGHDPGRRRPTITRADAVELIRSTGLPLPIQLKASVHPLFQDRLSSFLEALRRTWSDIGVEFTITTPDIATYNKAFLHNEGVDLMIGRWIGDYDDPDAFSYGLFHSGTGEFREYYSSQEFDQLAEQARAESEPARRERLYRKIDTQLTESHYFLPLFHEVDYRIAGPGVRKLTLSSNAPYLNYATVGMSKPAKTAPGLKLEKGTLVVPITGALQSLDPTTTYFIWQGLVLPAAFDTLTRAAEGARIIPWLASRVVPEDGARKYRFHLRDGVRFHDGRRLTSRDVRYSFEHLISERENQNRWFLAPVRGAESILNGESKELEGFRIISSTEFVIELEQPLSFFPALLAYTAMSIIPAGSDPHSKNWREGCAGTGAFRVTSFEPGRSLKMEANPDYWRPGLPKSSAIEFVFNCTPQEILAGFKSGRFSLAWDLPPADVDRLRHEGESGVRFYEIPILSSHYLAMNVHKEPFSDLKLRRKFFEAIDVDGLVRRYLARLAVPGHTLIPPGLLAYEPSSKPRALAPARHSGERVPVKIMFHSVYETQYGGFIRELLRSLDENGFDVEIIDRKGEYRKISGVPDADVTVTRWLADYPDADSFMNSVLQSERGGEGPFCGSAELDQLIEKGRTENEPSARQSIYTQIEELLRDQALVLPLFYEQAYCFTRPKVEGLELNFFNPYVPYEYLWLRPSTST